VNLTIKRAVTLAALGTTGILAPVAGASAAMTPAALPVAPLTGVHFPTTGFPATGLGFPTKGLPAFTPGSFVGPSVGQVAAVIGPTIITTAPSTFINTNNQVSAGSAVSGGQAAP
jgi:hypothetical protein